MSSSKPSPSSYIVSQSAGSTRASAAWSAAIDIHDRMLNHRPFLSGEINRTLKLGDKSINNVEGCLNRCGQLLNDERATKLDQVCEFVTGSQISQFSDKVNRLIQKSNDILEYEQSSSKDRQDVQMIRNSQALEYGQLLSTTYEQRLSRLEQHFVNRRKDLAHHYAELQSKWTNQEYQTES